MGTSLDYSVPLTAEEDGEQSIQSKSSVSVDSRKITHAVRMILEAIGEDPDREGLIETPKRVARMYAEMCSSVGLDLEDVISCQFTENVGEAIVVRAIRFSSLCEHHLVPFAGEAHIAYLPRDGHITGLSKLARLVDAAARRPQVQERMTEQIADAIASALDPLGVAVSLDAEHLCMSARGVKKPDTSTVTLATRGIYAELGQARAEVLAMLRTHNRQ